MESSDLWEKIDQMAQAEPMDPEDDLALRLESSAKVHAGGGRKAARERTTRHAAFSPSKSIAKRRSGRASRLKPDSMKIDTTSAHPSAAAVKAAAAAINLPSKATMPPLKLKRSYSI